MILTEIIPNIQSVKISEKIYLLQIIANPLAEEKKTYLFLTKTTLFIDH